MKYVRMNGADFLFDVITSLNIYKYFMWFEFHPLDGIDAHQEIINLFTLERICSNFKITKT